MNRNAVKKFATWARSHLREQMEATASRYGLTRKGLEPPQFVAGGMTVAGSTYDAHTAALYRDLRVDLGEKRRRGLGAKEALESLTDEMAYTWFNRLTALRYMEVNGYTGRSLSSETEGVVDPDLLRDAAALVSGGEFAGVSLQDLDTWRKGGDEAVYRNLLVHECKKLAETLPFLFGGKPYAALFLPHHLLNKGSIVRRLERDIPEESWRDIEIIGWLYQFYISERKDEVMKAKGAYKAPDIPAATQLFTPHWIVRYMVENSLGRLWLEAHPESGLREHMPYFLPNEGEGVADKPDKPVRPQDLTLMDPACGSGHILVYAFDLLFLIYTEAGYADRDIPALILEHNLFGLDIDERAAQLASFALLMKARGKSRRVLRDPPPSNVTHTLPTRGLALPNTPELKEDDWQPLLKAFEDADNLGSLITPPAVDFERLEGQLAAFEASGRQEVSVDAPRLRRLIMQTRLLTRRYSVVGANPPYMGSKRFNNVIKDFVTATYPRSKSDLFAVFMERALELTAPGGVMGMINQHAWMFLSSYESLREHLLDHYSLETMLHLGPRAFPEIGGEVVQSTTFTVRNAAPESTHATFARLVDFGSSEEKESFFNHPNYLYVIKSADFKALPSSMFGYWLSPITRRAFEAKSLGDFISVRRGLQTGNAQRFIRQWFEVLKDSTHWDKEERDECIASSQTWFRFNNGGDYRRWYGNFDSVVDWASNGSAIKDTGKAIIPSEHLYFQSAVTWSRLSGGRTAFRFMPEGVIPGDTGPCAFTENKLSLLGYLNSNVTQHFLKFLVPSLTFLTGDIEKLPYEEDYFANYNLALQKIVTNTLELSQTDWDNFETSWDFRTHPLLRHNTPRLSTAFEAWRRTADEAFCELKRLEEENNRYWIEAYGLGDELSKEVPEEQITVRRADLEGDVKSLLSYAVGCMMGRYSLSQPGLRFAGGGFDMSEFEGFLPDKDGILPVTDEAYFEDDIVSRFVDFLRVAFGPEHLGENLDFVGDALSLRAGEGAVERIRRYFVQEFVTDHARTYNKRPIYWLFTSGPENAFGGLVYLHRYTPDTLARMRNEYVLPLQSKLEAQLRDAERAQATLSGSGSAARAEGKRVAKLQKQVAELLAFQDRLQHYADRRIALDLDDGVAYNYTLFAGDETVGGVVYEDGYLKLEGLYKASQWKRDLLAEAT